jgi:ribonuclease HI
VSSDPDVVVALELELLTPTCRGDRRRVDELLHDDFTEHGASGRTWTKAEILDDLEADPAFTGAAASVSAYVLAADVVLVTYEITGLRPSLRSSVWVRDDSRWRLRFHQGTLRHAP